MECVMFPRPVEVLLAAGLCCVAAPAFADDPLGFYIGAGIGESTVNGGNDGYGYGPDGYYLGHHDFAWKVIAGLRPISIVGAEVEYIDFGHPGNGNGFYGGYGYSSAESHPRALAAFGVGHLPLPLPFLDIFGKLGVAHLRTEVSGYAYAECGPGAACPAGNLLPGTAYLTPFSQSRWDTRFAYGAGIQSSVFGVDLRAEYERISSPFGDPDLFSVGVTWGF
jgi:hypothetical protein